MVTFACATCGDSVRKNAVDKHGMRCRFTVVTCIDCFKEFSRSSYLGHNQCMTEKERYEGRLYAGKGSENKGQKKQDNWLQNIQEYVESGKAGPLAHQLQKLLGYANIPRKKNKFVNFASSCLGLRSPADVERVWSAIEAANRKDDHLKDDKSKQSNGRQEAEVPEDEERKDHLKGVASAPVADRRQGIGSRSADVAAPKAQSCLHFDSLNQVTCDAGDGGPSDDNVRMCLAESSDSRQEQFSWKKTIKRLLKASEGKEMPLKHLQRQAYALYKTSSEKSSRIPKSQAYHKVMKGVCKIPWLSLRDEETIVIHQPPQ